MAEAKSVLPKSCDSLVGAAIMVVWDMFRGRVGLYKELDIVYRSF